jgi:hypothetical protein
VRLLPLPLFDHGIVYDTCVNSIAAESIRNKFQVIRKSILELGEIYIDRAKAHKLYLIAPSNLDDEQLAGQISCGELKNLYTQQFAGLNKPARAIYDKLITSVPHGRCPFCGFGQASTLDHFLPKNHFSWLSVFVPNLIPACKDCNHGKSSSLADSPKDQIIHPYFDDPRINKEQWLFASINQTSPISIIFNAKPPIEWEELLKLRVGNHLRDFDLSRRFSLEAANEIASLTSVLKSLLPCGQGAIKAHLDLMAQAEFELHKNSWRTALYQTLAETEWYWAGGHT